MTPQRAELMEAIAVLWDRYPHWRLGQLIANVAGWADQDVWDADNAKLLDAAQLHLSQATAPEPNFVQTMERD